MSANDILKDPLITVTLDGVPHRGTLPEVLAWLSGDREVCFRALQPHQHHPWHAFTVQLAAIALSRGKREGFPSEASEWCSLLLGLTGQMHEPWSLAVDDLTKPALLQPPVPEDTLDGFKTVIVTPDSLDILLTTRNFDLKSQRMVRSSPEHWLFALVTKQTFEGYSGKMNYGIHRMNGGQANRPCVAIAPSRSWAPRFQRDVRVWLDSRAELLEGYSYDSDGPALLWLLPWDGAESLLRPTLDPFFVEICRRIRLVADGDLLSARMGTSQVARIDATDHAGATGDIWTPTQKSSKKSGDASLTVPSSGFNYRKLAELLFGETWQSGAALELRADDGDAPVVIAQALSRARGRRRATTSGWSRSRRRPARASVALGRRIPSACAPSRWSSAPARRAGCSSRRSSPSSKARRPRSWISETPAGIPGSIVSKRGSTMPSSTPSSSTSTRTVGPPVSPGMPSSTTSPA